MSEEKDNRERIHLTNGQWMWLIQEGVLEDKEGNEIPIEHIEDNYDGSRRHEEDHHRIFRRKSDGKYFLVNYSTSVKDEMGWEECNYGDTEAIEVFPKQVTKTIFE